MRTSRQPRRRPSADRSIPAPSTAAAFPRAVRGEDYARYAAATWSEGVRWLRAQATILASDVTQDAHAELMNAAIASVERELYPQEVQLLSELVQREWTAATESQQRRSPEIPSFLRHPK